MNEEVVKSITLSSGGPGTETKVSVQTGPLEPKLTSLVLWARTVRYVRDQMPKADPVVRDQVATEVYQVMRFLVDAPPDSASEMSMGDWEPTMNLRFVLRSEAVGEQLLSSLAEGVLVAKSNRILQQQWRHKIMGKESTYEWRDVPLDATS